MEKEISIGLIGLGVVGSRVIQINNDHQEELQHQLGHSINVEKVLVRDIDKARDIEINENALTTNPDDVINNDKIDVIVEVIGGIDLARAYMLKAFAAKKHIITPNKDLIALTGTELEKAAQENGSDLLYEASDGGGMPLLRSRSDDLAADRIEQVMGIVNGTPNEILTKMDEEGQRYED